MLQESFERATRDLHEGPRGPQDGPGLPRLPKSVPGQLSRAPNEPQEAPRGPPRRANDATLWYDFLFGVLASTVSQQLTTASEASLPIASRSPEDGPRRPKKESFGGVPQTAESIAQQAQEALQMCDLADSNLSRDRIGGKALAPFDPALCSLLPLHSSYPPRGPWPRFARQLSRWLSRRLACMPLWRLLSSQWGSLRGTIRLRGESEYAGGPDANPPSGAARGTPCAVRSM